MEGSDLDPWPRVIWSWMIGPGLTFRRPGGIRSRSFREGSHFLTITVNVYG